MYESDPPPVAVPLAPTERSVNDIPSPPPPALEAFTHLLVAASHLIVCVSCRDVILTLARLSKSKSNQSRPAAPLAPNTCPNVPLSPLASFMVVPALKYRQLSDLSQTRSLVPPLNVASPSVVDPSEVTVPITFNPVDVNSATVLPPVIHMRLSDITSRPLLFPLYITFEPAALYPSVAYCDVPTENCPASETIKLPAVISVVVTGSSSQTS